MRKILLLVLCIAVMAACKKEDTSSNTNNTANNNPASLADNSFKIIKGDGSGEQVVALPNGTVCGTETSQHGDFYSFRGFFSVGSHSTYDRLAVGFKTEPAAGSYPIVTQGYYGELPEGKCGMNITFDSYNYVATTGTVTVSESNGKKHVVFENVELDGGAMVVSGGTRLPAGSKISGAMVCQ